MRRATSGRFTKKVEMACDCIPGLCGAAAALAGRLGRVQTKKELFGDFSKDERKIHLKIKQIKKNAPTGIPEYVSYRCLHLNLQTTAAARIIMFIE